MYLERFFGRPLSFWRRGIPPLWKPDRNTVPIPWLTPSGSSERGLSGLGYCMESRNRLPGKPPRPERPGLAALAAMFGTRLWQQGEAEPILHLEVDSRRILTGENTLFIALSSSRREGMDFLPQA